MPIDSQPPHAAATRSRVGEMLKIGPDGRGAPTKRAGVHVVVTAIVDMAYEAGLRPGFQFHEKTMDGAVADRIDIARLALRSSRMSPRRLICQDGGHGIVFPEMKWRLSSKPIPSTLLTSTSPAPA